LFVTPGCRFPAVDAMPAKFHLPRSTLFMLVCAFCGLEVMRRAYAHAIAAGIVSTRTAALVCSIGMPSAVTRSEF